MLSHSVKDADDGRRHPSNSVMVLIMLASVAVLMAFCLSSSIVSDAEDGSDGGKCGDDLTWVLDDSTLVISGTGPMYDYRSTSIPWYTFITEIKSVVLEDGVTSIGSSAFYECTSLTSVTIPNTVTSINTAAFYECTSLTSVTIPDSVTSIGLMVFHRC
ncbi:MAG: leucine-rich repeat domain-containing protein, partial [Candidatus Methanomethylophilaceae archaeon]